MKDEVEAGPPRRGWDFRCVLLRRVHQFILIGSCVLGSWLLMQAVHESGHVLGASLTGGRVGRVVLYPLTISRTDLIDNPSPLIVVWAGPAPALVPHAPEVESIHRIPVAEFMRADAPLLDRIADSEHPVLRMPVGTSWIAAPTAAVLYQFRELCIAGRPTRVAHFDQPPFARR